MSEFKKRLKDVLEEMSDLLSRTMDAIETPDEEIRIPDMARAMNRLSDSIHMRISSLPKDTEHLRISRFNAVLLSQVISKWSEELDRVCTEYQGMARSLNSASHTLDEGSREFETERDKVLGLIEEMVPELDINSELRDAERT